VVAKVGDATITLGDYARALERMDPFDRLRYQTIEKRRELLDEMIDLQLLAAEAKRRGLGDDPMTQEAIRQLLRDALLDEVHKELPPPAKITQAEIQTFYEANMAEFREPERRRVSVIVLDDAEKAKTVLEATAAGVNADSWGKLFFENSTTAKSEKKSNLPLDLAGDLGVVSAPDQKKGANERVPAKVREAVFKLAKVGDVYPEVVSDGGKFYIVRMSGLTAAYERPVAEADRQIRVAILKQKMVEQEKQLEEDLRKKYKVEIDESVLARVKQP
jgi:peptidyl-prolyl cis-trans isomerase C